MKKGFKIIGCIVLGILFVAVVGVVTMQLWNWLVPSLFNGPIISFWQTLGLLVLTKILFSGFGRGGCCHKGSHGGYWKGKVYERFANMSPEDREALKKKMKDKWCNIKPDDNC